jgi:hypothetical protein
MDRQGIRYLAGVRGHVWLYFLLSEIPEETFIENGLKWCGPVLSAVGGKFTDLTILSGFRNSSKSTIGIKYLQKNSRATVSAATSHCSTP